jgi:hypothetical protein
MSIEKIKKVMIITIEGQEYITFPQALYYIGIERGILHQRILRESEKSKDEKVVNALNIDKYVFVPKIYCDKLKEEIEKKATVKELERYDPSDLAMLKQMKEAGGANPNDIEMFKLVKELGLTPQDIERMRKQAAKKK